MSISAQEQYDEQLRLFRTHDKQLLHTIYKSFLPRFIASAVYKNWCCAADAAEAYQEALTELCERCKQNSSFRLKSSLYTYLYGAAKCNIIDNIRHKRFAIDLECALHEASDEIRPDDATDKKLRRQYIHSLLDFLEHDEKQIIHLFYFEGLPWKTIAEIMDDSVENLKNRKCRILKKLKGLMNKQNG